jgi:hypothetical protein
LTPHTPPKYLFVDTPHSSKISVVDSQVCLLGDFYAHTSNVNEYIDVDNIIILDFCNIANEDQRMINNIHILEECGVSTNRYFGGVWGVNKQINRDYFGDGSVHDTWRPLTIQTI